jgi:hypothetical protein
MPTPGGALRLTRLGRLARSPVREPAAAAELCELCAQPVYAGHRHLLDLNAHRLLCACQACSVLFDRREAGGRHYRLIPDRCRFVEDFVLPDALWERLAIPVDLAFMFRSSAAGRMVAFYPSPAGATESLLELVTWQEIEAANPVLATLEPDVEALLVHHARGAREHWLAPVDECYRLVGLIRTCWRGLGGGQEVWEEIASFFAALHERSTSVHRSGETRTSGTTSGHG